VRSLRAVGEHPAFALLAAIGWSVATLGGTRALDMATVTVLVTVALAQTRPSASDFRGAVHAPLTLAVVVLLAWTLAVGLASAGVTFTSVRVPWLVVIAVIAVAAAGRLGHGQRLLVRTGLVVVGVAIGGTAVLDWVLAALGGEPVPIRAPSLLGYPNAAGVLLVATSLVTVGLLGDEVFDPRLLRGALALQMAGVLATSSRIALAAVLVIVAVWVWRHRTRRALAGALGVGGAVGALLVARFATSPSERPRLWRLAAAEIAAHPVAGRGPSPVLLTSGPDGGRPTTHAHNEFLQLAVEYGLVGLALALLALGVALAVLVTRCRLADPSVAAGCLAIGALAFTDFSLRITAVALILAVMLPLAWRPRCPQSAGSHTSWQRGGLWASTERSGIQAHHQGTGPWESTTSQPVAVTGSPPVPSRATPSR
jgi:hypothetical protein